MSQEIQTTNRVPGSSYTDEYKALCVARWFINDENTYRTAKDMGTERQNVMNWVKKYQACDDDDKFAILVKEKADEAKDMNLVKFGEVVEMAISQVKKELKNASAAQAAKIAKEFYELGRSERGIPDKSVQHTLNVDEKQIKMLLTDWRTAIMEGQAQRAKQIEALESGVVDAEVVEDSTEGEQ